MAKTRFINREGKAITEAAWKLRQSQSDYTIVRDYDNGVVQVTLKWNGRIVGPVAAQLPDYWPVFVLLVKNYRADGTLANDPVDNDQTFATELEGIAGYDKFVARWTDSTIDEEGVLVEEGNILTPPPPPEPEDPNRPSSPIDDSAIGGVGAW